VFEQQVKMAGSGMGCQRCREWQEHYYWEHMDVNKIRFFKLMTGDFQQHIVSTSIVLTSNKFFR
jgi:hypothetical protein